MTAKVETQSISQQYDLPYPPAKVWRALTEPELLAQWLMTTDIEPVVGHSFTFRSEPTPWWDGIVHCEVLETEPPKRLSYTWRSGPESSPLDTVVTWTLTPTPPGGTRLALEHSGFVPGNKFALDGARTGWQRMVGERLGEVLAQTAIAERSWPRGASIPRPWTHSQTCSVWSASMVLSSTPSRRRSPGSWSRRLPRS